MLIGRVHFLLFTVYAARLIIVVLIIFNDESHFIFFSGGEGRGWGFPNSLSLAWAQEWLAVHALYRLTQGNFRLAVSSQPHLLGRCIILSWSTTTFILAWRGKLFIYPFSKTKDLLSSQRSGNGPQLITLAAFLHSLSILEFPLLIVHDVLVK